MRRLFVLLCLMEIFIPCFAENDEGNKGLWPKTVGLVKKLGSMIDSMAVRGVDPKYIGSPKEPWQVIVKGNTNQTDLKMRSVYQLEWDLPEETGGWEWEATVNHRPSSYVGIWAGYRGYGFGYSRNVAGDDGSYLTFGATGGSYGVNVRIHRFRESEETDVNYNFDYMGITDRGTIKQRLESPIKVNTVIADGYYMFNGKRFSYAAAYDQSVVQLRSAGSLVAGAMYYYSHLQYAEPRNLFFIQTMNDVGRIRQWQASLGVGYAYNFVPAKGWLISAMALPVLTFYNRVKIWRYASNFDKFEEEADEIMDLFSNEMISYEEYEERFSRILDKIEIWEGDVDTDYSKIGLNFDGRLSVTYHWSRFFANIYGQYNTFSYKSEETTTRLKDWFVNVALGVRF